MSKNIIRINTNEEFNFTVKTEYVPLCDDEQIEPKIKIYDASNDGTYWYRKIGYLTDIRSEER